VADYPATAEIRREYFKDNYPAATGIIVNGLLRRDWLIEIEALTVLD
jgi:enamine deaminase RidA (YjgF/YER057c/UK114 family)